jgi:tetratricopeptide (TPR) repeat protein
MSKIRYPLLFISFFAVFFSSPDVLKAQIDLPDRQQRLKKANELFKAGEEFIREGNYQAANEAFKNSQKILSGQSANVPLDVLMPKRENFGSGSGGPYTADAKENPQKSGKKDKAADNKRADFYFNRAVGLINKGQYLEAEAALKETVGLNPLDAEAYYNLGILYEKFLGDKRKALFCYKKYLFLAPNSFDSEMVKYWVEDINRELGFQ